MPFPPVPTLDVQILASVHRSYAVAKAYATVIKADSIFLHHQRQFTQRLIITYSSLVAGAEVKTPPMSRSAPARTCIARAQFCQLESCGLFSFFSVSTMLYLTVRMFKIFILYAIVP